MNTTTLQYLENLFKEYQAVKGTKYEINNMFDNSYLRWLEARKYYLEVYKKCLEEVVGLDNIVLELDKGNLDSISNMDSKIILLTKYVDTFKDIYSKKIDKREIINGNLKKDKDNIIIESSSKTLEVPKNNTSYCVTSNPYNFRASSNKLHLLSEEGFNILMGIYGYIEDKNLDYKLNKLKEFQELVSGNLYQRTINNTYVAFVKKKGTMK